MQTAHQHHPVRILRPFFADDQACGLHRYFETDFVDRFIRDVTDGAFTEPAFSAWKNEERHSRHGTEPVLRLPLHRTFHVVSCEIVCDRLGKPALDPQKIVSAGFVIRKRIGDSEYGWTLVDGVPAGWTLLSNEDPQTQRTTLRGGAPDKKRVGHVPDSAEETYPMHPLPMRDAGGRNHTLLFGYVPLGGTYYDRSSAGVFDAGSAKAVADASLESLPWPFGIPKSGKATWIAGSGILIYNGIPLPAMFELLRLLVFRYHVGEVIGGDNAGLDSVCASFKFVGGTPTNLFSYLQSCFQVPGENPLVKWISEQQRRLDDAGASAATVVFDRLPSVNGKDAMTTGMGISESDARAMRKALGDRVTAQASAAIREMPMSKFTQGAKDLYQIVPFVRVLDGPGCERIHWADPSQRSILFRVAAPFDPMAARPSLIEMPSLSDLRRGLAKGAMMLTPPDTFDLLNRLKLSKGPGSGMVPSDTGGSGTGIQWICSFSLPVVTLVAMILLMVMVVVLNIVFFWLPWVRICFPMPKAK